MPLQGSGTLWTGTVKHQVSRFRGTESCSSPVANEGLIETVVSTAELEEAVGMATVKCPRCAREFVRRVSRVGFGEKFLSLFYVYPFKCQLCGFRFRFFQWGVRYIRVEEDRRVYDRMEVHCPVTFASDDVAGEGTMIDVSMGGCSMVTDTDLINGMIVNMSLQVSTDAAPILVEAALIRYVGSPAVGVEFLRLAGGERQRLQQFVRGLLIHRER
jgi:hypothetical protein